LTTNIDAISSAKTTNAFSAAMLRKLLPTMLLEHPNRVKPQFGKLLGQIMSRFSPFHAHYRLHALGNGMALARFREYRSLTLVAVF
jgi:hypothetical protein